MSTDAYSDTVNQVGKYQWLQTSRSSCQVKRMNSYWIKIKNKHEKKPDLANMSLMCSRKRIIKNGPEFIGSPHRKQRILTSTSHRTITNSRWIVDLNVKGKSSRRTQHVPKFSCLNFPE